MLQGAKMKPHRRRRYGVAAGEKRTGADLFAAQRVRVVALYSTSLPQHAHPASSLLSRRYATRSFYCCACFGQTQDKVVQTPYVYIWLGCLLNTSRSAPLTLYLGVHISGPEVGRVHHIVLVLEGRPCPNRAVVAPLVGQRPLCPVRRPVRRTEVSNVVKTADRDTLRNKHLSPTDYVPIPVCRLDGSLPTKPTCRHGLEHRLSLGN